jgi:glycosyltransferase involved in cell wall biosynthesis
MSSWQYLQFQALGRLADVAFFSVEPWKDKYEDIFDATSVHHLPVGSNIRNLNTYPQTERDRLGIPADMFVLGVFGSAHPSRLLTHISAAARACQQHIPETCLIYIGRDGNQIRAALDYDTNLMDMGPLDANGVSRCLAVMDIYLAPFANGVSTRRGSFLVGLAHGIPTVSTYGKDTGHLLTHHGNRAYILTSPQNVQAFASAVLELANDPKRRCQIGQRGHELFEQTFTWSKIATTSINYLNHSAGKESTNSNTA